MNFKKIISLVIAIALSGIYANVFAAESSNLKTISVKDSQKLINENKSSKNFIIIDIRTPEEYKDGHLENSVNIDYYAKDFKENLNKLDKSKKYLIYCRSGHRSGLALPIMKDLKFQDVYNMDGGINVWKSNNFPTVK